MPIQSRWTTPVPEVSLTTWLFGSASAPLPDRKVFIDTENPDTRFLTFSDFRLWSARTALGLQRSGLRRGDRVLVFSGNDIFFPVLFTGIIMAGGIFTGASPAFTPNELAQQLSDSGASIVFAATGLLRTAQEEVKLVSSYQIRTYAFDHSLGNCNPKDFGAGSWTKLLADAEDVKDFDWVEPSDPKSTICCLNYSSGTTGKPKGVEISHYSYVANGEAVVLHNRLYPNHKKRTQRSRVLCFMPMYHAAAQTQYAINFPKMGVPTYVMPAYNFEKMLQHVQAFEISYLGCAPPIMLSLAKSSLCNKYDLSSITEITCGTAPLAREVAEEVQKLWPVPLRIGQGWGMTELTCTSTICHPTCEDITTVGEAAPNITIKIMDGDREITQPNKAGELWVAGPTVMRGYWRNPKATRESVVEDSDGTRWLKTGDIGYADRYGPGALLYIVDRLKELIKVKGFQVAPAELEGLLLDRKDVIDAGVVGVVVSGEELPRAYVVKNSDVTEQEIMQWVESKLAKYKWLRGGVAFVDNIPRTRSGKIVRRVLRERAQAEVGNQQSAVSIRAKLS
ncbi:unnamed protein product [Clonostachys byssicola]|uniref:Uncharacterized protein n=1 Tax=Clonostachys byssicola TaxID=160290 RepID=A0A9N9U1Y2_9HYPO|nr:unnamed protein product [Clonostachys byssicola]